MERPGRLRSRRFALFVSAMLAPKRAPMAVLRSEVAFAQNAIEVTTLLHVSRPFLPRHNRRPRIQSLQCRIACLQQPTFRAAPPKPTLRTSPHIER